MALPISTAINRNGNLRSEQIEAEAAEHAHAADRFAREIDRFLRGLSSALAATERQSVGQRSVH